MASARVNEYQSVNSSDVSSFDIVVLLVDHDAAALVSVGAMLRECGYGVMTTTDSLHALDILRGMKKDLFDLVICDLHMPVLNGFQLLITIKQEFQSLPVIMISADANKSVMLRSLKLGASFFLTKPVKKDDVKDLWQFAVAAKKESPVVAEGIGMGQQKKDGNLRNKRKPDSDSDPTWDNQVLQLPAPNTKKRMVWTDPLHCRFLDALRQIGLRRQVATPKNVHELMNVPGLTKAHIASHLQKYRLVVKRLMERSSSQSRFDAGASLQLLGNSSTTVGRQRFGKQAMRLADQGRQQDERSSMEPNMFASQGQLVFPNLQQQTSNTVNSVLQPQYDKSSDAAAAAASGAQLLLPDHCKSTIDSVNDILFATGVMNKWPDMTHRADPSSLDLDGANTNGRQHPVANPRSLAAGPMNSLVTNENSSLTNYLQDKQTNLGSVGMANLCWNTNLPLSNRSISGYMVEGGAAGSSSTQSSQPASQLLPAEVTEFPTQLQQQYDAGRDSGDLSDIVTSSMMNAVNADEEELDDEELFRYFIQLEK